MLVSTNHATTKSEFVRYLKTKCLQVHFIFLSITDSSSFISLQLQKLNVATRVRKMNESTEHTHIK